MKTKVTSIDQVRPEVQAFAILMEQRLQQHSKKGGWKEVVHYAAFQRAHRNLEDCEGLSGAKLRQGLVDAANYAMIIADNDGQLKSTIKLMGGN